MAGGQQPPPSPSGEPSRNGRSCRAGEVWSSSSGESLLESVSRRGRAGAPRARARGPGPRTRVRVRSLPALEADRCVLALRAERGGRRYRAGQGGQWGAPSPAAPFPLAATRAAVRAEAPRVAGGARRGVCGSPSRGGTWPGAPPESPSRWGRGARTPAASGAGIADLLPALRPLPRRVWASQTPASPSALRHCRRGPPTSAFRVTGRTPEKDRVPGAGDGAFRFLPGRTWLMGTEGWGLCCWGQDRLLALPWEESPGGQGEGVGSGAVTSEGARYWSSAKHSPSLGFHRVRKTRQRYPPTLLSQGGLQLFSLLKPQKCCF